MRFRVNDMIYRWSMKRFLVNLTIIALIAGGCILYNTRSTAANNNRQSKMIVVQKGDTLWSIAESVAPRNDPRYIIEAIKRDNNLRQATLTAGQHLQIQNY